MNQDGPILKQAQSVPRRVDNANTKLEKPQVPVDKNRLERWKATGVVALSQCNLKVPIINGSSLLWTSFALTNFHIAEYLLESN